MGIAMHMKLRHVYRQRRRDGSWGHRFERPGFPKRWLRAAPGSAEFVAEWARLMRGEISPSSPRHVTPGSISWLVNQYRASAAWSALAPATRKQRSAFYRQITDQAPDAVAAALTSTDVRRWRDNRARTPGSANNLLKAMRALYAWGMEMGHVPANPVAEVKRLPGRAGGFEPWTVRDVRQFGARWPAGSMPRLAMALLLFTACRRSDVVRLGRQHLRDGWIVFDQAKGGQRVEIPVLQPLAELLPAARMTFLVTAQGRPFSAAGFGNWFRARCDQAGIAKRAHGIRKAAGGLLAEMGCTPHEIMAVLGHADERTSAIYTRSANRRILAESAMKKLAGFKW